MNTIEGNKLIEGNLLIVKFMNFPEQPNGSYDLTSLLKGVFGCENDTDFVYDLETMCFIGSWDWLVPIAEKCRDIATNEMEAEEWDGSLADMIALCNIELLYEEIIEFIKWYNKNK